jgi:hypothetical protein
MIGLKPYAFYIIKNEYNRVQHPIQPCSYGTEIVQPLRVVIDDKVVYDVYGGEKCCAEHD